MQCGQPPALPGPRPLVAFLLFKKLRNCSHFWKKRMAVCFSWHLVAFPWMSWSLYERFVTLQGSYVDDEYNASAAAAADDDDDEDNDAEALGDQDHSVTVIAHLPTGDETVQYKACCHKMTGSCFLLIRECDVRPAISRIIYCSVPLNV